MAKSIVYWFEEAFLIINNHIYLYETIYLLFFSCSNNLFIWLSKYNHFLF